MHLYKTKADGQSMTEPTHILYNEFYISDVCQAVHQNEKAHPMPLGKITITVLPCFVGKCFLYVAAITGAEQHIVYGMQLQNNNPSHRSRTSVSHLA